ncbi:hypothetical protein NAPIS_ORF00072 [Vairimorpha apis BRL 01]|uniref:Uncharacterized protein n=1 Tax=Vairimorpha apis BRL 01 TaxID=1037528 RepID=T0L4D9_9MICR|nr:hypothetical protein NAPIS_ORF00072 [Vairimorpha apis BRL 01]
MIDLLNQIKTNSYKNLLNDDIFNIYLYLYNHKLTDPRVKKILINIKNQEIENDIEKMLIYLFFNTPIIVFNIKHFIYIQEFFPKFNHLIKLEEDLVNNIILEYYYIYKNKYMEDISKKNIYRTSKINIFLIEYIKCITNPRWIKNLELYKNTLKKCFIRQKTIEDYKLVNNNNSFDSKVNEGIVNNSKKITISKNIFKDLIFNYKTPKKIIDNNVDVDKFLLHYNLKAKILMEDSNSILINHCIQFLSDENLKFVYDFLEDKSHINYEINKRKLFIHFIDKIIRDTLISFETLINLEINKKIFFKHLLHECTKNKDNLKAYYKKFFRICKIMKTNKRIFLIEWLKCFIYYKKFDLYCKVFSHIKQKLNKSDLLLFKLIYKCIKKKTYKPFIIRMRNLSDSKYCIFSYRDICKKFK